MHHSSAYPNRPPAAGAVTRWLVPMPVIIRMSPGPKCRSNPRGPVSGSGRWLNVCDLSGMGDILTGIGARRSGTGIAAGRPSRPGATAHGNQRGGKR